MDQEANLLLAVAGVRPNWGAEKPPDLPGDDPEEPAKDPPASGGLDAVSSLNTSDTNLEGGEESARVETSLQCHNDEKTKETPAPSFQETVSSQTHSVSELDGGEAAQGKKRPQNDADEKKGGGKEGFNKKETTLVSPDENTLGTVSSQTHSVSELDGGEAAQGKKRPQNDADEKKGGGKEGFNKKETTLVSPDENTLGSHPQENDVVMQETAQADTTSKKRDRSPTTDASEEVNEAVPIKRARESGSPHGQEKASNTSSSDKVTTGVSARAMVEARVVEEPKVSAFAPSSIGGILAGLRTQTHIIASEGSLPTETNASPKTQVPEEPPSSPGIFDDADEDDTFDLSAYKPVISVPPPAPRLIRPDIMAAILGTPPRGMPLFSGKPKEGGENQSGKPLKRRKQAKLLRKVFVAKKEQEGAEDLIRGKIDLLKVLPESDCRFLGKEFWVFTLQQLEFILAEKVDPSSNAPSDSNESSTSKRDLRRELLERMATSSFLWLVTTVGSKDKSLIKKEGSAGVAAAARLDANGAKSPEDVVPITSMDSENREGTNPEANNAIYSPGKTGAENDEMKPVVGDVLVGTLYPDRDEMGSSEMAESDTDKTIPPQSVLSSGSGSDNPVPNQMQSDRVVGTQTTSRTKSPQVILSNGADSEQSVANGMDMDNNILARSDANEANPPQEALSNGADSEHPIPNEMNNDRVARSVPNETKPSQEAVSNGADSEHPIPYEMDNNRVARLDADETNSPQEAVSNGADSEHPIPNEMDNNRAARSDANETNPPQEAISNSADSEHPIPNELDNNRVARSDANETNPAQDAVSSGADSEHPTPNEMDYNRVARLDANKTNPSQEVVSNGADSEHPIPNEMDNKRADRSDANETKPPHEALLNDADSEDQSPNRKGEKAAVESDTNVAGPLYDVVSVNGNDVDSNRSSLNKTKVQSSSIQTNEERSSHMLPDSESAKSVQILSAAHEVAPVHSSEVNNSTHESQGHEKSVGLVEIIDEVNQSSPDAQCSDNPVNADTLSAQTRAFEAAEAKLESWKKSIVQWREANNAHPKSLNKDQFPIDGPLSCLFPVSAIRFALSANIKNAYDFLSLKKTETGSIVEMYRLWRRKCELSDVGPLPLAKQLLGVGARIEAGIGSMPHADKATMEWMGGPMVVLTGAAKDFIITDSKMYSAIDFVERRTKELANMLEEWRIKKSLPPLKGTGKVAMISGWKALIKEAMDVASDEGRIISGVDFAKDVESLSPSRPEAKKQKTEKQADTKKIPKKFKKKRAPNIEAALASAAFLKTLFKEDKIVVMASVGIKTAQDLLDAQKQQDSPLVKAVINMRTGAAGPTGSIEPSSCVRLIYDWCQRVKQKVDEIESGKPEKGKDKDKGAEKTPKATSKSQTTISIVKKPTSGDPYDALSQSTKVFLSTVGITTAEQFLASRTTDVANKFITYREDRKMAILKGLGAVASISGWKALVRKAAKDTGNADLAALNAGRNAGIKLQRKSNTSERTKTKPAALEKPTIKEKSDRGVLFGLPKKEFSVLGGKSLSVINRE
jgi:hypothetical protein